MNEIVEGAQPHIVTLVSGIIAFLVSVVLCMLAYLQKRVIAYFNSKTSVNQREMIYKYASEAFAIAENAFKTSEGKAKLNFAYSYTSDLLAKANIKITDDEIKAAIEKSVLDYNLKKK